MENIIIVTTLKDGRCHLQNESKKGYACGFGITFRKGERLFIKTEYGISFATMKYWEGYDEWAITSGTLSSDLLTYKRETNALKRFEKEGYREVMIRYEDLADGNTLMIVTDGKRTF